MLNKGANKDFHIQKQNDILNACILLNKDTLPKSNLDSIWNYYSTMLDSSHFALTWQEHSKDLGELLSPAKILLTGHTKD